MNTYPNFKQGSRFTEAVEKAKSDDQKLRLARIQNGADPAYKNGCAGGKCGTKSSNRKHATT